MNEFRIQAPKCELGKIKTSSRINIQVSQCELGSTHSELELRDMTLHCPKLLSD